MDADSLAGRAPATRFPVSDHCDGERFFNPEASAGRSLLDVLRWQLFTQRTPWPDWIDDVAAAPLPAPGVGELVVTFINHSTFLLRTRSIAILTDPVYAERASPVQWAGPRRIRRPGVAFDRLPHIDLVLISHDHYDHLDVETLRRLAQRDAPQVVTPLGNRDVLASAISTG